jgi:hypothetical protein
VTGVRAVDCRIRPSATHGGLNLLIHGAALAGAWLAAFDIYFTWALCGAVIISLWYTLREQVLLCGDLSVLALRYPGAGSAGQWQLRLGQGQIVRVHLDSPAVVTPFLVAMAFRCEQGHRYSVPLFQDAIGRDEHRRLRALLRMSGDTFNPVS